MCCVKLDKPSEAEAALSGDDRFADTRTMSPAQAVAAMRVPNGACGHHLLGVLCKDSGRTRWAAAHFAAALAIDPFAWSSHEELCALGAESEAESAMKRANPGRLYPPLSDLGGLVEIVDLSLIHI